MKKTKLIVQFLFLSLLFVSTLSRADEAIALLESIRASRDYRELKSKHEIPAPILAKVEKFSGTIYDKKQPFLEYANPLNSVLAWAVTDQNYYIVYLSQIGGIAHYDKLLMYLKSSQSQEVMKVMELNYGGEGYINNYPTLLEMVKTRPPRDLSQSIMYRINQFLLNR